MEKIITTLWKDYEEVSKKLESIDNCDIDKYELLVKERDNIRNELIELEKMDIDKQNKIVDMQTNNRSDKIRNIINIATFTVTTLLSLYSINKTFKFDEESNITSTLGKGILNGFIPKTVKR